MRMTRWLWAALALLVLGVAVARPGLATVWCHDYVIYRVFGEDVNNTSAQALRARLDGAGFRRFPFSNAARQPDRAMKSLKPGYVIILGDAHSGYVNDQGLIDHFIQLQGEVGKVRRPDQLPKAPIPGNAGGLFLGDTLKQMLGRRFSTQEISVEVWRR